MPKLQLFEYAVLFHHKPEKDQAGNDITKNSELIVKPTIMLAPDQQTAAKKAARAIDDKYEDQLDQCDVRVRPF